MIKLLVQNTALDLDEKARMTIRLHNPAFDADLVSRAYSFPFSIPASGRNMRALGHINRLDVKPINAQVSAQLQSSAGEVIGGFVEIGSVRRGRVELTFKNEARNLVDELGKIELQSIFETMTIPQVELPYFELRPVSVIGGVYTITINGQTCTPVNTGSVNDIGNSARDVINLYFPNTATYNTTTQILSMEPGDVDAWNIEFAQGEYVEIDSKTVGQVREENFQTWINSLLVTEDARFSFPMVYAPLFYTKDGENRNPLYFKNINWNRNGNYSSFPTYQASPEDGLRYPFVPFLRLSYVFEKIAEAMGWTTWLDDSVLPADFLKMHLFNNVALEAYSWEYESNGEPLKAYNYHAHTIDLNLHAPKMTAKDFIIAYATFRNARIEVEDNVLRFISKRRQLLNAPNDWSEWLTVDYELEGQEGEDLTFKFVEIEKDDYPTPVDQLESRGTGTKIIEIPRPLPDLRRSLGIAGEARYCVTQHRAKSERFKMDGGDIAFFRPFWAIVTDSVPVSVIDSAESIYLSTHFDTDSGGTVVLPFSMELDHPTTPNLWSLYFKEWAQVERGRGVTFYLDVPLHRLTNVDNWTNGRIFLYHDMGQVTVIASILEVQVRGGRQGLVKVEARILN